MPMIVVTSSLPHRPCAHRVFSGAKAFPLDTFDADELRMILADGHLTLVVGDVLTDDKVDEFVEAVAAGVFDEPVIDAQPGDNAGVQQPGEPVGEAAAGQAAAGEAAAGEAAAGEAAGKKKSGKKAEAA